MILNVIENMCVHATRNIDLFATSVCYFVVLIVDKCLCLRFKQAGIAKAQGINVIAIGVGTDIFSDELNQMASGPKYVSEVADFSALENTVNVMRNLICTCKSYPLEPITVYIVFGYRYVINRPLFTNNIREQFVIEDLEKKT